ncbi:MAG: hypothetical protein COX81_03775 [Candidatus Magasanikbacteria bacterium CG_4_10_14_0_2_um_filter_37_12]|uniref:Uncharacterized protein n=2 Tax=Parcubacteria group TaxID=1794811 RepID=A0A2M8C0R8_9BACT|nr:MAG: hypothetical protein COX81_03775 [Candidatus Magasanikbacteria bacterium CG_4_10_14_0_2_um_filter_37_12]PJB49709.1 MAG: hypothetical protein CO102_03195 [Candidatus Brennerbacteria bacterium CG_4_9_14_3_um_filter_43_9]
MNDITIALVSITTLFVIGLAVKRITTWKFCVICSAVSGTWVLLLVLSLFGYYKDELVIALLMGQSIIGMYYLLEKRLDERFHLFRLPYILTGTFLVYVVLTWTEKAIFASTFVVIIWLLFGSIYLTRRNPKIHKLVEQIIACCRDW